MGNTRSISAIDVPITSDISGFSSGLKRASKEGQRFAREQSEKLRKLPLSGVVSEVAQVGRAFSNLGKSGHNLFDVASKVASIGAAAAGATGPIGLVLAGLAGVAAAAAYGFGRISEIGKSAADIGTTAEELSRLRTVAVHTGTDFKDLAGFVSTLTAKINESIGRADLQASSFAKLGTSAEALAKLPVGEQLRVLNKGFNALPNAAEKARVAVALGGREGLKSFRLLTLGVDEFEKAYRDGLVTTDDDVSEVRKLQIGVDKVVDSVEKLTSVLAINLVRPLNRVAEIMDGIAGKFGIVASLSKGIGGGISGALKGPAAKGADPAKEALARAKAEGDERAKALEAGARANLTARKIEAAKARKIADDLQAKSDKQAEDLRRDPGKLFQVPTTNRMGVKVRSTRQGAIDNHSRTGQELNAAKMEAKRLHDESLSDEEANGAALRMKQVAEELGRAKDQYAEIVRTAGMDDVHRRTESIKGLSEAEKKSLNAAGYRAREAGKTSSLRDEVQESVKLPQERLSEELNRIGRLAQLGVENGGISHAQAVRAAAMKTRESGLGEPSQLAGALDARSAEGRSYLLRQMNRTEDPTALARRGLELTGQGNNLLGKILDKIGGGGVIVRY